MAQAFGNYRLLSLLGRGGMGEVWRAHDTRKDREVAVKVLGAWLGADPDYARRFRREAALAARLNAPNILPIHDYGDVDGRLYIEMPLVEGIDLDALLRRDGSLPASRAVAIIDQMADALDAAHRAGLVHRDVKPSNVLIANRRNRDIVYLIDFGIASAVGSTTISTIAAAAGTPAYMAPERFVGEGDHRGDLYALACVLYAALTGRPPFVAPSGAYQVGYYLNAHQNLSPTPPSEANAAVPATFDEVIARGMAKDPDDRYPTAGDLAAAASAALSPTAAPGAGASERADPPPAPTSIGPVSTDRPAWVTERGMPPAARSVRASAAQARAFAITSVPAPDAPAEHRRGPVRPRRVALALGAILAVFLVMAAIANLAMGPGGGTNTPPATAAPSTATSASTSAPQLPPASAPFTERQLTGHDSPVTAVTTAQLDGRPVIISGGVDMTVRVWDLATVQPIGQPLSGHTETVWSVTTGQLGARTVIVSGGGDGSVKVWDLTTHALIGQTPAGGPAVAAVAVTQLDGRPVIVQGGGESVIRVWDLATLGPIGEPLPAPTRSVLALTTAQLGGRSVIIAGYFDGSVRVWDLVTHTLIGKPLLGHTDGVYALATAALDRRAVLVTGSADDTVRVWDLATHSAIGRPLTAHVGFVLALATAQLDGRTVVISGSTDSTILIWDLATHAAIGQPLHHDGFVRAVAIGQVDGRTVIVSGSDDKTVRTWDLADRAHG